MSLSASPVNVVEGRRLRACLALEPAEKLDLELFMKGSKQRLHRQAAASFKFKTSLADTCVQEASGGSANKRFSESVRPRFLNSYFLHFFKIPIQSLAKSLLFIHSEAILKDIM